MSLEELVGKKIDEIYYSKEDGLIVFKSNDSKEQFVFVTEGDCCSHTWIEYVGFESGFLPATIMGIKEDHYEINHPEYYCLQTYYIRLISFKDYARECLIEFKNSSNGYYGGSLEKYEGDFNIENMKKVEGV